MSNRFTEYPDRREWDLSGYTLDQIVLDYALTLLFACPSGSITAVIEQAFELRVSGRTEKITPEETLTTIPLLPFLHKPVVSMTAFRDGRLLIKFADGTEIDVPKYHDYETWNTYGSGEITGADMLCSPSGSPWGG